MATRKIRLTLSGTKVNDIGPIIDVDFNNENLDADFEVIAVNGESTVIREYTVDVAAGTYNLDINYKNDMAIADENGNFTIDRNLYVNNIEIANDGINYNDFIVTPDKTSDNLVLYDNYLPQGWVAAPNPAYDPSQPKDPVTNNQWVPNPNFDPSQPRTDGSELRLGTDQPPGNNAKIEYVYQISPVLIRMADIYTFNITFS